MSPERGDYVVEFVPGGTDKHIRVRRFLSVLDLDQFFASEDDATSYALTMAAMTKRRAFRQTDTGWIALREGDSPSGSVV